MLQWILLEGLKGLKLLKHLMILEGIKSIQYGENVRLIKDKLYCLMGEEFIKQYYDEMYD